jgi:adenosylcobinamide kinase/adenosylcobinamide-phosphate guanylyltransferase
VILPDDPLHAPLSMTTFTLVTGGARSGKSFFAERLALDDRGPVLYVATARVDDDEMRARVEEHRRRRPREWRVLERPTDVASALAEQAQGVRTVLLEDVALLVSNLLFRVTGGAEPVLSTSGELDEAVAAELDALLRVRDVAGWNLVVVTNEVGWGIVPATPLGRIFRDALGRANQALAARADTVYLLVAGVPLRVKPTL